MIKDQDIYRRLVESATEYAIIGIDIEGAVASWSSGAERMFGWGEAEIRRRSIALFLPPTEDAPVLVRAHMQMALEQGSAGWERWLVRKDGSRLWASGRMFPLARGEAVPDGFVIVLRDITSIKRDRQALQARATERDRLWLLSEDLLLVCDFGSIIMSVNPAWERMLGLSEAELIGASFRPLVHPDDREKADAELGRLRKGMATQAFVNRLRHKDGSFRWIAWNAVPDDNRVHAVGRNITDQRNAEEEARHKTALLETTLENMDQGLLVVDARGRVSLSNRRAQELLDLPAVFLSSRPHFDEVKAYQIRQGDLWPGQQAELKIGRGFHLDPRSYERKRPNGTIIEVRTVSLPDGVVVRTYTDISARRQAEEGLRESEERYRALVEVGVSVVWRADPDGKIIAAEGRNEFIGQPLSEYVGAGWIERVHPDDRAMVAALWQRLQSERQPGEAEYRVRSPDGDYHWVHAKTAPLMNSEGTVREWVGTLTNVTQRHKLEEQLRQSQKMEAVGQLTGGIAHDFNNLLTIILGNAELLAEQPSNPDLTKSLSAMIFESAERGADLTTHLLAFGRRQMIKPERIRLAEVVNGLEPLLRRTVGEHITLVTEIGPGASAALADRSLLESAILNLVVNARDAMPEGGTLTIRTGESVAGIGEGRLPFGQPVVFVTVSDTGTGIPADMLPRVFEPFFTTKSAGRGTGLGLSMVYGFAEQSGGHVGIESQVGQGTAVTILLRAVSVLPSDPPEAEEVRASRGQEAILLVEDEATVRQFVCSQLVHLGYDVTAVGSGPEALDVLNGGRIFDLLFTDVVLPKGTNGVELARQARELIPGLKVLLTSGYPEEVFQREGSDTNLPLLRKPFRRRELAETLRRIIG